MVVEGSSLALDMILGEGVQVGVIEVAVVKGLPVLGSTVDEDLLLVLEVEGDVLQSWRWVLEL